MSPRWPLITNCGGNSPENTAKPQPCTTHNGVGGAYGHVFCARNNASGTGLPAWRLSRWPM